MLVRASVISPAGGAIVVAGVAASTFMSRGDNYRYGIQNEAGEGPLLGGFRPLSVLGSLGLNALPFLAEKLQGVPVLGDILGTVAYRIPDVVLDYAQLLGLVAGLSFVGTEALAAQETGQFAGIDLPSFLLFDDSDDAETDEVAPAIAAVAAEADNVVSMIAAG